MSKTERLTIKILMSDKAELVHLAEVEGEPVAVIVRRIIRRAIREAQVHPMAIPRPNFVPSAPVSVSNAH